MTLDEVSEDLSYVIECIAEDLTGEAKSTLSELADNVEARLLSDHKFKVDLAAEIRQVCDALRRDKREGSTAAVNLRRKVRNTQAVMKGDPALYNYAEPYGVISPKNAPASSPKASEPIACVKQTTQPGGIKVWIAADPKKEVAAPTAQENSESQKAGTEHTRKTSEPKTNNGTSAAGVAQGEMADMKRTPIQNAPTTTLPRMNWYELYKCAVLTTIAGLMVGILLQMPGPPITLEKALGAGMTLKDRRMKAPLVHIEGGQLDTIRNTVEVEVQNEVEVTGSVSIER